MARVTFLLPQLSLTGGIRVAGEYARELKGLGHQVSIVTRKQPRPRLRDILRRRATWRSSPEVVSSYFREVENNITVVSDGRRLRSSDLPDADFLIATWWETVEWTRGMPSSKGRLGHLMQGYEMFPWLPRERVAATYKEQAIKISVSEWVASKVLEQHGVTTAAVIHNAVDLNRFGFCPERSHSELTLGFVYSSAPFKNSKLVFDLQDVLNERGIPCRFIAFHSDPMPSELSGRLGIEAYYRPEQEIIPTLYQRCDLWLFPTLEEGFGLPIIEALSCGTPVLATHAGAAPQLIKSGENGYLCEPSAEAFADVVEKYSAMRKEKRMEFADAARASVENWTWKDAARRLIEVLEGSS